MPNQILYRSIIPVVLPWDRGRLYCQSQGQWGLVIFVFAPYPKNIFAMYLNLTRYYNSQLSFHNQHKNSQNKMFMIHRHLLHISVFFSKYIWSYFQALMPSQSQSLMLDDIALAYFVMVVYRYLKQLHVLDLWHSFVI